MSLFTKIFGDASGRTLRVAQPLVAKINSLESQMEVLIDADFPKKTLEFKERLTRGETLDDLLPEAFALVREVAKRTLGERHYDVQLLGGIMLHSGKITEMKTGEGKSLVSTLPTYLNALTGKGVHVVTVNDYLSRRDSVWMGQIFNFLGLSVGLINHDASYLYDPTHAKKETDEARDASGSFHIFYEFLKPCSRGEAYSADITYGTNNEFGFDYLRDNISTDSKRIVQTNSTNHLRHNFAIIDEVDSVLVDEARTPLIISAPTADSSNLYKVFTEIANKLEAVSDFEIDEKRREIALTENGIGKAEKMLGVGNIYTEKGIKYVHHLETAVRAKALFLREKDYVVKNGEVIIVDEFTGRLQPGRRWSEGLHQAIEAKEGVAIKQESRTYASVTLQNYFKLYEKIAGMTGTALTSAEEFQKVYGLETVAVPTHQTMVRQDLTDLIFQTEKGKIMTLVKKIKAVNAKGQPLLIGTVSIEKNEFISAYLKKEGIPHKILNAKNHEEEGEIIAGAGKKGSVVVATNMAGRGVDIKLGGVHATKEEYEEVKNLGGLYVIGTERHEARRIDNQLRGRSGRQGDPGMTQFFISLEDSLARVFAPEKIKGMMKRLGIPEDEPIQNRLVSRAIESAQSKIEGFHFDARKHLLDYDSVLNHQRLTIYARRREVLLDETGAHAEEFLIRILEEAGINDEELDKQENLLEEKRKTLGDQVFGASLRQAVLQFIDLFWVEHLESMDYLRGSVRLRAYGQRDPLVEYKREGLTLFKEMEQRIAEELIQFIPNVGVAIKKEEPTPIIIQNNQNQNSENKSVVGRNDPCPCGSGKKYKKCHGQKN
ncbi:MAG: preprotein translocase subunit SecA [Patescibacteria group bacterium]